MALTAGTLSKVLIGQSTAVLSSTAASGGTGPYTQQWYFSTTTGFTPGAGNIINGATGLTLNQSGIVPGTTYYYVVVYTDVGASTTINSAQLTVVQEPSLSQNQFAQSPLVGVVDMRVGPTNVIAAQVDASVTSQIYPGQAVKIVASTLGGIPKVAPVAANSDAAIGFAIFNIKDLQYVAGQNLEVALWGSVIWCYATAAVSQFARVCLDVTYVGGVQPTGATATIMGWAFDGCAGAGLIRVMLLPNSAFATA
jgi:hypothetical protein